MKPLTLHAEAEAEIEEAIAYYEGQRAGLGREFREDLEDARARIRRSGGRVTDREEALTAWRQRFQGGP